MNDHGSAVADGGASRTLLARRVIRAARRAVYRAFAEPERLARWWGPKGFTNTFSEIDWRPGGRWRFVMHGPDGGEFPNESEFVEIVPDECIVIDHLSHPGFRLTVTLAEHAGGTLVTWRQEFDTAETCAKVRAYAEPANEQNLDRLEAEVAALP
jgi:uncharacterized protein YndB with AHSA1/START domain